MPVELLLSDPDNALLYVFLDENQDIYGRSTSIPIAGHPMVLATNCRNTTPIHAAAYRTYMGDEVQTSLIDGTNVQTLATSDTEKQAAANAAPDPLNISTESIQPHALAIRLSHPL